MENRGMPVKVSYFSVVFVGLSVAGKGKSREPQWQRCACSVSRQWKLSVWRCFFDVARMIPAEKAGFTEGLLRFSGESWALPVIPPSSVPLKVLMSAADAISKRLKYMRKGQPFSRAVFAQVGSRAAVDKALSKLVRSGLLERVARGIYMRPKLSAYTGRWVRPSPLSIMSVITKANGETIQIHGAEAVRRLGLSTQMQVVPTFYTSGATRDIKIGNAVVRLRHASSDRLQHAGTKVGVVLSALYYLGKEGLSVQVVSTIGNNINRDELIKLKSSRMPAWMRSAVLLMDEAATATSNPNIGS